MNDVNYLVLMKRFAWELLITAILFACAFVPSFGVYYGVTWIVGDQIPREVISYFSRAVGGSMNFAVFLLCCWGSLKSFRETAGVRSFNLALVLIGLCTFALWFDWIRYVPLISGQGLSLLFWILFLVVTGPFHRRQESVCA
jgi:hypothetical protein